MVSIIALVVGFVFLSEATTGVGIIAVAGVLAIFARLAQSSEQHNKVMDELETIQRQMTTLQGHLQTSQGTGETAMSVGEEALTLPPDSDEAIRAEYENLKKKE